MKIIDGVKHKGSPFDIPDASRYDLGQFCVDMGYKTIVEIGVWKGEFLESFVKQPSLTVYGIDPWMPYEGFDIEKDNNNQQQDENYLETLNRLKPYSNFTLLRKTSMEALGDFEDDSIDLVYIDGNHCLKFVTEDIVEWSKKVKKGGVISGHDYIHPRRVRNRRDETPRWQNFHVKFAVDAYIEAYRIENWYLIGRQDGVEGEKRDKYRSWIWIKE